MADFKLYSNIVNKNQLRHVQNLTLDIIANSLVNSFGPMGTNTAYRKENDIARYTKDGHTILSSLMFNGPIEFTTRDNLIDITRRIITTVGDGTTSAVVLSQQIFKSLCNAACVYGIPDKQLITDLNNAIKEACEIIESNKKEPTIEDIRKIAMISTDGNEYIANLITSIYEQYGMQVFIDVAVNNTPNTYTKEYDGFTIDRGLTNIAFINNGEKGTCSIRNPRIYIFEDPIDSMDTSVLLNKIIYENLTKPSNENDFDNVIPTVIICPKIGHDVETALDNLINTLSNMTPIQRHSYPLNIITNVTNINTLLDLAYISGAKTIRKYIDPRMLEADQAKGLAPTIENVVDFCGYADEVITDHDKTKVINPKLMKNEDGTLSDLYSNRLADMKAQLESLNESKEDITAIGLLKRRINAFSANLVEIHVGGISMTDRDALRDLVEDAVLNCRSAANDGFGYGANYEGFRAFNVLLNKSIDELKKDHGEDIVDLIAEHKVYNIYQLVAEAYLVLLETLYRDSRLKDGAGKEHGAQYIITNSLIEGCPFNIRKGKFDGEVLSSIKTDQIILEAIGKILGTAFLTNQFLVSSVEYNRYMDMDTISL